MASDDSLPPSCACAKQTDRYVSFAGIDCDGQARRIMECLERHFRGDGATHPFLAYFMAKREPRNGQRADDLFLIHSSINPLRDYLEASGDRETLELLGRLETDCC